MWAKNNDAKLSKLMGQQVGIMLSVLEHRIPELFFTSEEYPGEAVSAVKALAMASAQGQRIYQVSDRNVEGVVPLLKISEEVKREIRESVAVGKVVVVSQGEVRIGGWKGVGYIISDPETGGGAYRIGGGGENGAWYDFLSIAGAIILGLVSLLNTLSNARWVRVFLASPVHPYFLAALSTLITFTIILGIIFENNDSLVKFDQEYSLVTFFSTMAMLGSLGAIGIMYSIESFFLVTIFALTLQAMFMMIIAEVFIILYRLKDA